MTELVAISERLETADTLSYRGKVTSVRGLLIRGDLPNASIGTTCRLDPPSGPPVWADVVGLDGSRVVMMPLSQPTGLTAGTPITVTGQGRQLELGDGVLGRVLDGIGAPMDGKGPLENVDRVTMTPRPINPMDRKPISRPFDVGVRAINGLMTLGEGQRVSIMASAGVGKSTLLAMMARNARADVVVLGLIGERGREVREFIERDLEMGSDSSRRVVVVAATSDESAAMRLRAAHTATSVAEYFRDKSKRVLLLMDSLTRVVMAQREIGLSVGEPPATRGYPPSAFAVIPQLLERAGNNDRGSITAIYTTLFEANDHDDPIADAVRGTADGHIVLSRELAEKGQYPAIDVLGSLSRVMSHVTDEKHQQRAARFRELLADFRSADELRSLGAYEMGTNPRYDRAIRVAPQLRAFIAQRPDEHAGLDEVTHELVKLVEENATPDDEDAIGSGHQARQSSVAHYDDRSTLEETS
jgi:flagellum-specific ATP synthase